MKLLSIIDKSLKEQFRSFWILLLTLSMGPLFIFVYYLIIQTSTPRYTLLIINNDKGITTGEQYINHGQNLTGFIMNFKSDTLALPFIIKTAIDKSICVQDLKNKKADALIIIPGDFSQKLNDSALDSAAASSIEFIGDLTSTNYLLSAVWANELIAEYSYALMQSKRIIQVKETALGVSSGVSMFDIIVPGIMIFSLVMLMFTASIAFVSEIENKTIMRLKLSRLTTFGFLGGISIVQLLVGVTSVLLTLLTAMPLGFHYEGSLFVMILIASLTSISIISFSLIIAAATKTANEVLVVGNFPMFLFMFFTGAAFPIKSKALFTIAGYPVSLQGLMTPTHAISALNKTLVMNMEFKSIIPEITAIISLTIVYFMIGALLFRRRHLRLA